jgi:hypothetical protein
LALATVASLVALLFCATGAAAYGPVEQGVSGGGRDVASSLSSQLLHWASLIIIPTAAIMALPALFKRDIGHALVTLVIVLIVGAFAFDPGGVQNLVESLANKILGG